MTRHEIAAAAVVGAARVSDTRPADAVVVVDAAEHARRVATGGGAVTDLSVLHALMCLPLGEPVPVADLGVVVRDLTAAAPDGCVEWLDHGQRVRRLFTPAARVPLVLVRSATWRPAWQRANAFEPFAARVVLLTRPPRQVVDIAWEADADGIGLWITNPDGEINEVLPPAPYVTRYVKPARWRFTERAYAAWLAAQPTNPTGPPAPPASSGPAATARFR